MTVNKGFNCEIFCDTSDVGFGGFVNSDLPVVEIPKERTANTKYRIFPSKNHAKPK
jgi:hypothetical protein